jgi:hypothetical protein
MTSKLHGHNGLHKITESTDAKIQTSGIGYRPEVDINSAKFLSLSKASMKIP